MKAVILAGGFGTRLSEETMTRPKPMVEIAGKRRYLSKRSLHRHPISSRFGSGHVAAKYDVALSARVPRKHRQAQIDGAGVERVDRLLRIDAKRLPGIRTTGDSHERQGKLA